MLKQFLSRLPKKALKTDPGSGGGDSGSPRTPRSTSRSAAGARSNGGLSNASNNNSNNNNNNNNNQGQMQQRPSGGGPKRISSAVFPASVVAGIEPLVPFKDVAGSEKMNLFVSKVSLCCVTFDFADAAKNSIEKDVKRQTLLELVEFLSNNNAAGASSSSSIKFSEPAILAMCRMCAINLFRVFPPNYRSNSGNGGENEDDEPSFDPAWPHLQLVYELLLKFVTCSSLDAKVAKKYIDHAFILRLLELFDSDDPRERDCLKTILHRIYGKFMVHRPFIRKSINNLFYKFLFETERHNGITELLEIYGSVISGFALPLKEEHRIFLWKVLIPLHKPKNLGSYFQQLSYCVTQFIEKEPKLVSVVIKGLLKYWPITSSQKEVMFLGELEEILEAVDTVEFQKVMVPLFCRIASSINSFHFQVSERALFFWNNDHIVNLIAHNRQAILPIIIPALEKNAQNHWNQAVLNLTVNVRKMFVEMDDQLFVSIHAQYIEDEAKQSSEAKKRKEVWERLENAASLQPVTGNTAVLVTPRATKIAC